MTQPVALITGCSSGIGQALAFACLDEGYQVWATARNPASLEPLVQIEPPGSSNSIPMCSRLYKWSAPPSSYCGPAKA